MPTSRKTLFPVELEAAVVVVQAAAAHAADHPVEDPAGIDLVPGIVPGLLPAADHVVALLELGQKSRNLGRVVLEVAVEREDHVAPGGLERRREGGRLAEIAAKPDRAHPRIAPGQRGQDGPRAVAAAIVDENELDRPRVPAANTASSSPWSAARLSSSSWTGTTTLIMSEPGLSAEELSTSAGGRRNKGNRIAAATSSAATQTSRNTSDATTA